MTSSLYTHKKLPAQKASNSNPLRKFTKTVAHLSNEFDYWFFSQPLWLTAPFLVLSFWALLVLCIAGF